MDCTWYATRPLKRSPRRAPRRFITPELSGVVPHDGVHIGRDEPWSLRTEDLCHFLPGGDDPPKLSTRCQLVVEYEHWVRSAQEGGQIRVDLLRDPLDEREPLSGPLAEVDPLREEHKPRTCVLLNPDRALAPSDVLVDPLQGPLKVHAARRTAVTPCRTPRTLSIRCDLAWVGEGPVPKNRPDLRIRWWRGEDLNLRPSGYEPDELPDCSTPRRRRAVYTPGAVVGHGGRRTITRPARHRPCRPTASGPSAEEAARTPGPLPLEAVEEEEHRRSSGTSGRTSVSGLIVPDRSGCRGGRRGLRGQRDGAVLGLVRLEGRHQVPHVGVGRRGGAPGLRRVVGRAEVAQHGVGRLLGLNLVELRLSLRRRVLGCFRRRRRRGLDLVEKSHGTCPFVPAVHPHPHHGCPAHRPQSRGSHGPGRMGPEPCRPQGPTGSGLGDSGGD